MKLAEKMDFFKFLQKYPFLVQQKDRYSFIGLYKQRYRLKFYFPNFPSTVNHHTAVFRDSITVNLYSEQSSIDDVIEFVNFLLNTLESADCGLESVVKIDDDSTVHVHIVLEILSVLRQHGCQVTFNRQLTNLELVKFENKEEHLLALQRTAGHHFKVSRHTLPEQTLSNRFKRYTTMQRHVQMFLDALEQLREFYHNLNAIDELCYVILPAKIDTKTVYRVFKYDRKIFLKVALHPLEPTAMDIAFFGPTKQVAQLRKIYYDRREDWDPECNVYSNLLRIFNIIAFPIRLKAESACAKSNGEFCGICINYHDADGSIPIISCDNEQCSLIFHTQCLKEWFSAQRGTRAIFAISIGNCPYCTHKISSSFDEMMLMTK